QNWRLVVKDFDPLHVMVEPAERDRAAPAELLVRGLPPPDRVACISDQSELGVPQPARDYRNKLAALADVYLSDPVAAVDPTEDVTPVALRRLAIAVEILGLDDNMR